MRWRRRRKCFRKAGIMEQQDKFRQVLQEVRSEAEKNGRIISRDAVQKHFEDSGLNEEQIDLVCTYLMGYGIQVTKRDAVQEIQAAEETEANNAARTDRDVPDEDGEKTGEEIGEDGHSFLEDYVDEINRIPQPDPEKEFALFAAASAGNRKAKQQLAAAYLSAVCDMASEYEGKGLETGDLVQEANVGLMLALDKVEMKESLAAFRACLMNEVSAYLQQAVDQSSENRKKDQALADRVSHLSEAAAQLKEETGGSITPEELAEYLNVSVDEIRDIMRLAGDDGQENNNCLF